MSCSTQAPVTSTDTLWDAAERLRTVRRAHERFLALWALDNLLDAPAATAHAMADIDSLFTDLRDPDLTPDNHTIPVELQRRFSRGGALDD